MENLIVRLGNFSAKSKPSATTVEAPPIRSSLTGNDAIVEVVNPFETVLLGAVSPFAPPPATPTAR